MKSGSDLVLVAALLGAHLVACRDDAAPTAEHAHASPTKCATCHLPEFEATKRPPHVEARPTTCGVCHLQTSWHHWRVDHPFWELTGAHARAAADEHLAGKENQVKCFWCHRGDPATWKDTKKECVACHAEDKETSRFPGHEAFADTCQDCHSTEKWKPAKHPPRTEAPRDAGAPGPLPTAPPAKPVPTAKPAPKPAPKPTVTVAPQPAVTPKPVPSSPPPDVISRPSRRR